MGVPRRRTISLLGTALVAGIILTGCSSGSADEPSSSTAGTGFSAEKDAAAAPEQNRARAAAIPPAQDTEQGKDSPAEAPDLSVDQRSIIYTGSITIRVEDVNQAAARVTAIANGAGGFVGGDKRNTSDGSSDATMELRVPAEKFSSVVDQLARTLGTEEQRGISTEDVTEQTVDLDARIIVQQARVDSGRKLLARAKTLNELVMLEKEVATRESDLASLQAKKRRLADLTALSTITVVLLDPQAAVHKDNGPAGFLGGLSGGWKALLSSLAVVVTVLGALLPWLIALGIPIWGIVWAFRRYARRRPRPVMPAAAFAAGGAALQPPANRLHPTPADGPPATTPPATPPPTARQADPPEPPDGGEAATKQ